jgi:hypothetical protein
MIYPNTQIITKSQNLYFLNSYNGSNEVYTDRYHYLAKDYNLDNQTAIVILSQVGKYYKSVINFIKKNNISKIYFFIDDVFRSSLGHNILTLEEIDEIKIINHIMKKTKIKNYKLFHCEHVNDAKIDFADLYLNDYFKYRVGNKTNKKNNFIYKINCLNNRRDIHRQSIVTLLCNRSEEAFLTINQDLDYNSIFDHSSFKIKNLDLDLYNQFMENMKYYLVNKNKFLDPKNNKKQIISKEMQHGIFPYLVIEQSFLSIVTETTFFSNFPYLSEKTFKPIFCYRPFVLLGPSKCLAKLKDFGFKTFDKWWDESYDDELDHAIRLQKVYRIAETILNKNINELELMLTEMSEVLNYNKLHLENISNYLLPKIEKE